MDAFVLHYVRTSDDRSKDVKLIDVYSPAQNAEQAVERMGILPGFCDMPNDFHISRLN